MKWYRIKKSALLGLFCIVAALTLSACSNNANTAQEASDQGAAEYHKISVEKAKVALDSGEFILLDVREQYEYNEGHIPGAVLLPSGSVAAMAAEVLPDPDQKILVYCRSGNRSKTAANTLVGLGYTQVYDFGGIIDWPYEVVKE